MSGIYLHIPFCKQACHYCDFHFSTSLKKRSEMIVALQKEIALRKEEITGPVETIYFGGGTPSLLTNDELRLLIDCIHENFEVTEMPEITLEANPDDLSIDYIIKLANHQITKSPNHQINRLSIGIQSFYNQDLELMNRAHNAVEALQCISESKKHFDSISIDLIYGIPGMSMEHWERNLETAISMEVPHLSCYALTVEPKTALENFIRKGKVPPVDEELTGRQYKLLLDKTEQAGYENYEFSNFGKPGYHSRNNTAYWEGKPYLGIGPSAHSFDGTTRSWNVRNNTIYINGIMEGNLPLEREQLTIRDRYNEYIMTGLRTARGVSLEKVNREFGPTYKTHLLQCAQKHLDDGLLTLASETLTVSRKGKFLSDGIASDLFLVN